MLSIKYALVLLMVYMQYEAFAQNYSHCTCVPYYLCTANKTIIVSGEGLIDFRFKETECDSLLDMCCTSPNTLKEAPPLPPLREVVSPLKKCGNHNPEGVGRRIAGAPKNLAEFGEFPWIVDILRKSPSDVKYRCAGSLIHPRVVLTAAHCVAETAQYTIRAGEWDRNTTKELIEHQDREVATIKMHEDFFAPAVFNDIALLFLKEPVELKSHIGLICLPSVQNLEAREGCYVAGWGQNVFGKRGVLQDLLKKEKLPTITRSACVTAFGKTRLGSQFKLHKSFMCAGGAEGVDACTGDGGAPLICPIDEDEEQFEQVGIVSWGIGCGEKDVPGAYADVAYFRSWIDQQLKDMNIDLSQ